MAVVSRKALVHLNTLMWTEKSSGIELLYVKELSGCYVVSATVMTLVLVTTRTNVL